ncbi:hypothetical protein, partial [Odoribacter laneus]|uniref:hypothetical protein n=1 Tax=Odoribacter laneus TaxID=626933 RepID=UPI003AABD9DC
NKNDISYDYNFISSCHTKFPFPDYFFRVKTQGNFLYTPFKPLHFPDFKSQSPAYLKSRAKRKIIAGNILLHT